MRDMTISLYTTHSSSGEPHSQDTTDQHSTHQSQQLREIIMQTPPPPAFERFEMIPPLPKPPPSEAEGYNESSPCGPLENGSSNFVYLAPRSRRYVGIDLPMRMSRSRGGVRDALMRHNIVSPQDEHNQHYVNDADDELRGLVHVDSTAPALPALDEFDFNDSLTPGFAARIASFGPAPPPFFGDEIMAYEPDSEDNNSKSCSEGKVMESLSNSRNSASTQRRQRVDNNNSPSPFQPITGISLISGNVFTAVATYAGEIDEDADDDSDDGIYLASWER